MKQSIHRIIIVVAVVSTAVCLAVSIPAAAQINPLDASCNAAGANKSKELCSGGGSLEDVLANVISAMIFLIGAAAVVAIVIGGIYYVTAAGDESKVKSAKNTIMYAVIGLILAVVSYGIVDFVLTRL